MKNDRDTLATCRTPLAASSFLCLHHRCSLTEKKSTHHPTAVSVD
ncbi:hypothetical protein [Porphyromonas loveana]